MNITRRHFFHCSAALTAASGFSFASAQTPLLPQARLLVGFPAGGGTDVAARRVADGLRDTYARMTLVENKPGASGRLVVLEAIRGPADGSIIVVQPDPVVTQQPHVDPKNTPFKWDDLTPVASIGTIHQALAIGPMVPDSVRNMNDFFAWAKANPKSATFGTPGPNSSQDFLMKVALKDHGIELIHVPYRGSAPGIQDLIGGQVAAMFSPVGDSLPHAGTGRARAIGTSGARRSRFTPDVPTFEEQGYKGMELIERFGVWVKAGVPEITMNQLHSAIQTALKQQALNDFFAKAGIEAEPVSRQEFAKAVRDSYDAWGERVRKVGYKPEN